MAFSPLSPQAEQKEYDKYFANQLQMYVSKTFTKAKKSVLYAEYPSNELKISFIQIGEHIFHNLLISSSKLRKWNIKFIMLNVIGDQPYFM